MIQPQLTAYHFSGPPEPVLLDVQSILPERILLLDAYFYVVIFHGQTVATWRKAGYHTQAEHAAFAQLLLAPQAEAKEILTRRFPVPRLVDCDHQGSQVGRWRVLRGSGGEPMGGTLGGFASPWERAGTGTASARAARGGTLWGAAGLGGAWVALEKGWRQAAIAQSNQGG